MDTTYQTFEAMFDFIHYPAGEPHVSLKSSAADLQVEVIEAQAASFNDLGLIVTADRILKRTGTNVRWFIPYFPFARHDRRIDMYDGLELQLALEMVSELDVVIADPHSESTAVLPHFSQAAAVKQLSAIGLFIKDPIVVIPDAGAAKKAYDWLDGRDVIQAHKKRDQRTGKLSGFAIPNQDLGGRPCVIVDDICDGGGTFLGLADVLKEANAGPLTLAVTHGLFTKGTTALTSAFAEVMCFTTTGKPFKSANVTTLPFYKLYNNGDIT